MTKEVFSKAVAELAKEEARKRYPTGGLVLSVICRDLPRPDAKNVSQVHRKMYNQDYAWFRESEAQAFLPGTADQGRQAESQTRPRGKVGSLSLR